jgi:pyruvate/2-oxoglutarate dehydrogenase complex dihydrolipoamide dehydrogenase (E3) component
LQQYESSGAELIMGAGDFVAPKTLEVRLNDGGTRVLVGDQVFVNIGTHATIPIVPGLDTAGPLTNIEALELDYVPQHLIVLGGGYVGLELAQAYRRFGSRVTIIEHGPQLAGREDPDVADEMRRILGDEGIDILVAAETRRVQGHSGGDVSLLVRTSSGEQTIEGSDILVAAGRTPNTAGIGLEAAGVDLDGHGYIKVNERLETTAPEVWAIGECAGSQQFTHVSFDDFRATDEAMVSPDGRSLDDFYLARPGADEEQLDLFGDYKSNIALYPTFQAYFRTHKPPFLAVWGKNDPFFLPRGAEAFKRDIPGAVVRFFDTGHFALETHAAEIAAAIGDFLAP